MVALNLLCHPGDLRHLVYVQMGRCLDLRPGDAHELICVCVGGWGVWVLKSAHPLIHSWDGEPQES